MSSEVAVHVVLVIWFSSLLAACGWRIFGRKTLSPEDVNTVILDERLNEMRDNLLGDARSPMANTLFGGWASGSSVSSISLGGSTATNSPLNDSSMNALYSQVFTQQAIQPANVLWGSGISSGWGSLQFGNSNIAYPVHEEAKGGEVAKPNFSRLPSGELLVKDIESGVAKVEGAELRKRVMAHLK